MVNGKAIEGKLFLWLQPFAHTLTSCPAAQLEQTSFYRTTMNFKELIVLLLATLGFAAVILADFPVEGNKEEHNAATTGQPSRPATVAGEGAPAEL